jgi:hypothetical protein
MVNFTRMLSGLFIAIFFQSSILALLCFTIKQNNRANKWLGFFFLAIALQRLFQLVLTNTGFLHNYPALVCLHDSFVILGLYFVQLYVFTILNNARRLYLYLALLVVAVQLGIFFPGLISGQWAGAQAYYHHQASNIINIVIIAYTAYVLTHSIYNISRGLRSGNFFGSRNRLILNAMRWLLYYWAFRMCFALVFLLVRMNKMGDMPQVNRMEEAYLLIVNLLLILLLGFTAYFSLRNPQFFEGLTEKETPGVEGQLVMAVLPEREKKIIRMPLPPEESGRLWEKINSCMQNKQPWPGWPK